MSDELFGGGIAVGNRLVSLRMWNSAGNEVAESDRIFYGWLPPRVNELKFEELRMHLIYCPAEVLLENVMELIGLVDQGKTDQDSLNESKLGKLVEEIHFKISSATVKTVRSDENETHLELDVLFDDNIVDEIASISSQESNDPDTFESWELLAERLDRFFSQ